MVSQAAFIQTLIQEEYTIPWTIPNFLSVLQSPLQLASQNLVFEMGLPGTTKSKWVVNFMPSVSQTLMLCLQMIQRTELGPEISIKGKIECISARHLDGLHLQPFGQFESHVPFSVGQRRMFTIGLPISSLHENWRNLGLMPGGPLNVKITLCIIFPNETYATPVQEPNATAESQLVKRSIANLQKCLTKLSRDTESADLKILCSDGTEFDAHRQLLRARNPVFDTMLGTEMLEGKSGVVKMDDLTGATMSILLHFFYTGELKGEWSKPETIHEFVYAAGKYQLDEVLEMLDAALGTETVSTCDVHLLSLANKLGLKNADTRLATKLGQLFSQVKNGDDMMKLLAN